MSDISSAENDHHKTVLHPTNDEEKTVDGQHARNEYDEAHIPTLDINQAEMSHGVAQVEAAQTMLGNKGRIMMYIGIALASYVYSLDGYVPFLASTSASFF